MMCVGLIPLRETAFETSSGSLTLLLLQIKTFIFLSPSSLLVIRMNAACRPSIQLVSSAFVPVIAEKKWIYGEAEKRSKTFCNAGRGVRNDPSKSSPEINEVLFVERKECHRGLGKSAREEKVELVEYFPKK